MRQLIMERLKGAKNVLLAGCGGGYDVFGALPMLVELEELGKSVHLANLTFTSVETIRAGTPNPAIPILRSVSSDNATSSVYCPEAWLARWLADNRGRDRPIWCLEKTGVVPLRDAYSYLVSSLALDAVVLVDGGIDAILRGDETSLGTPSEDLASVAAIDDVDVATKLIACVGLGAEMRDGIPHAQALARIAELNRLGGYLGAWSLVASSQAGALYQEMLDFVARNQAGLRQSHIHSVISRALDGEFGSDGPAVWISPLLPIYWFFDFQSVASSNLFVNEIKDTQGIWEVVAIIEALRKSLQIKERTSIPI